MQKQLSGGIIGRPAEHYSDLVDKLNQYDICLNLVSDFGQPVDLDFYLVTDQDRLSAFLTNVPLIPVIVLGVDDGRTDVFEPVYWVNNADELVQLIRGFAIAHQQTSLEEHIHLLAEIVETSPNIVSYSDQDFKVRYMNKTGLDRFGYSSIAEIAGASAFFVRSDDPNDPELALLLKFLKQYGTWRGEKILTDVRGDHFPAELIVRYHQDSKGSAFYSLVGRDISAQKNRDRQIVELQTLYETLAEASQEMIVIMSDQGRFLYANNAYKTAFSLDIVQLEPLNVFTETSKYAPVVSEAIQRVFKTLKTDYVEDVIRLDEKIFWLGTWLVPIPDHDEQVHSILLVSRDISREKESELSLIQALDKEREFNDLQSRFVSMISHEFKTPLSTILSSIELLKEYHDKLPPEKKDVLADRIQDAVGVMNRLLEDILLIGRIKDQKRRIQPEWIDPVKFSSDLMETILWNDQFGHPIKFSVAGADAPVWVDPELLRHILDNLLNNAIKYSATGSKILFNLDCSDNQLRFEIIDEGVGMSAETLERIYDPFFRGDNSSGISGTGLGMTIVHKALDILNGSIDIKSELGQGSVISISIPVEAGC
jgi:PAS domain S-box-containing protein